MFVYIPLYYLPACDDLYDVCQELHALAAKWSHIGFALHMPTLQEEAIHDTRADSTSCLRMMLSKWLQKSYNYAKYGPPTWRLLVKAVGDPFGGSNCALAETIANKHPGLYWNEVLVTCMIWYLLACSEQGSSKTLSRKLQQISSASKGDTQQWVCYNVFRCNWPFGRVWTWSSWKTSCTATLTLCILSNIALIYIASISSN